MSDTQNVSNRCNSLFVVFKFTQVHLLLAIIAFSWISKRVK